MNSAVAGTADKINSLLLANVNYPVMPSLQGPVGSLISASG